MKTIIKFIQDNFPNIKIFENYEINQYFTANYVITQSGVIKAVFVEFKELPKNLSAHKEFEYYSTGQAIGISFYFDKDKIYRNIQTQILKIELQEVSNEIFIFDLFSKETFQSENIIADEETKNCLIAISDLQKMVIEKFQGNRTLSSLIDILKTRYTSNVKLKSFSHNIKYRRTNNEIGEIWISFDSDILRIKFKEECNKEYIYGFELNFNRKNYYISLDKLLNECNQYKNQFMNTDYLISIFH